MLSQDGQNSTQVTNLSGSLCIDSLVRQVYNLSVLSPSANYLVDVLFYHTVLNPHRYISLQVVLIGFRGL
jgi:hypothetical protein